MEGVAVADGFRPCASASVSTLTTFPFPAHRTQRADFPHWACLVKIRSGSGSGGLGYEEGAPVRTEGVDEHFPDRHGVAVLGVEFAAPLGLADLDLIRGAAATAWDARHFAKGCKEDGPGAVTGWFATQAPRR